jgi:hypothetical protein
MRQELIYLLNDIIEEIQWTAFLLGQLRLLLDHRSDCFSFISYLLNNNEVVAKHVFNVVWVESHALMYNLLSS